MTDQKLEQRLAEAISRTAPNDLQGVLSRCDERKGIVIPMTTKKKSGLARTLIAACLALILVGGGGAFWQQNYAIASVVSLDVNPSIELTVNRNERVLSCAGLNQEAAVVLNSMDGGEALKNTDLNVAVNAIVGALVRNGYLDSISSAILISVEDRNQARAVKLEQELSTTVDSLLKESASEAAVLSQTIEKDTAIEEQAKNNHISTGKAALISRIMAFNESLDFHSLSALSIEELKDLAETGAPGMPIGMDEAANRAIAYANADGRVNYYESDPELDDSPAHYDVELHTAMGEFEYEVEAYTGEILSGKADIFSIKTDNTPPAIAAPERIGRDKALSIAQDDFFANYPEAKDSGTFRSEHAELDEDDGRLHYDIDFHIGKYEADYEIDAFTGAVLSRDVDIDDLYVDVWNDDLYDDDWNDDLYDDDWDDDPHDDDWDDDISAPTIGTTPTDIGSSAAKAAAFAHAGVSEGQVTDLEVERDEDDGRLEYEVEFKSGRMEYEYTIDAYTGAVLSFEQDYDD